MHPHVWRLSVFAGLLLLFTAMGCGDKPDEPTKGPSRSRANYDREGYLTTDVERPASIPNLVILLIDTLRGDALALPDDKFENHMPYLASLAKQGVAFRHATAPAPWTMPSVTSILTGLMPHEHKIDSLQYAMHLSGSVTTAAEALRNGYGFDTLGFAAGPWFDSRKSMWQGFRSQSGSFSMQGVKPILQGWVDQYDGNSPFFLMLHTFEAHDPYGEENHPYPKPAGGIMRPPPGYDAGSVKDVKQRTFDFLTDRGKRLALENAWGTKHVREVMRYMHRGYAKEPAPVMALELRKKYFDGVRWVDGLVKKTVDQLREWGLLEDTLLVVTSDHGEAFGEHGTLEHGRQLYDELLRVPLVMVDFRKDASKQKFRGGKVFTGPTGVIDIIPTFFEYAGLKPITGTDAASFFPKVRDGDLSAGRPVYSEERLDLHNTMRQANVQMVSARSDGYKYILIYDQDKGTVVEELYDLRVDPGEINNLVEARAMADVTLPDSFCDAVEDVRNHIWGAASAAKSLQSSGYSASEGYLDPKTRPAPCGSAAK